MSSDRLVSIFCDNCAGSLSVASDAARVGERGGFGRVLREGRRAWRVMRRGPLSVAAYWAGAAHPRRQKHREMPPPGASAPAFAATVEPASTHITSSIPPTYLRRDSSINACWGMGCCLHRFLISGPDLRIDAGFSPFIPSFVHRFLISSPNLRIDAGFCLFTPSFVHRFLILGLDLRIDARFSRF